MLARCSGTNRDGTSCSGQARPGRTWCSWHDPDLDAQRAGWRRAGGKAKSNAARARKQLPDNVLTTGEVRGLIGVTIRGVLAGRVEPGVGNAVANLARVALTAAEQDELEARLAALEAAAGIRGTG